MSEGCAATFVRNQDATPLQSVDQRLGASGKMTVHVRTGRFRVLRLDGFEYQRVVLECVLHRAIDAGVEPARQEA